MIGEMTEFLEGEGKVARMYVDIDTFTGKRERRNYRVLIVKGNRSKLTPKWVMSDY